MEKIKNKNKTIYDINDNSNPKKSWRRIKKLLKKETVNNKKSTNPKILYNDKNEQIKNKTNC